MCGGRLVSVLLESRPGLADFELGNQTLSLVEHDARRSQLCRQYVVVVRSRFSTARSTVIRVKGEVREDAVSSLGPSRGVWFEHDFLVERDSL